MGRNPCVSCCVTWPSTPWIIRALHQGIPNCDGGLRALGGLRSSAGLHGPSASGAASRKARGILQRGRGRGPDGCGTPRKGRMSSRSIIRRLRTAQAQYRGSAAATGGRGAAPAAELSQLGDRALMRRFVGGLRCGGVLRCRQPKFGASRTGPRGRYAPRRFAFSGMVLFPGRKSLG